MESCYGGILVISLFLGMCYGTDECNFEMYASPCSADNQGRVSDFIAEYAGYKIKFPQRSVTNYSIVCLRVILRVFLNAVLFRGGIFLWGVISMWFEGLFNHQCTMVLHKGHKGASDGFGRGPVFDGMTNGKKEGWQRCDGCGRDHGEEDEDDEGSWGVESYEKMHWTSGRHGCKGSAEKASY